MRLCASFLLLATCRAALQTQHAGVLHAEALECEHPAATPDALDALHAILGCDRAALADEATRVPCEPLAIARRPAPPPAPPPTRAHRHRFCLTPEPPADPPPPPPDPFARVVYEEPAELPDRDVVAV